MDRDLIKTLLIYGGLLVIIWFIVDHIFGISKSRDEQKAQKERDLENRMEKGDEAAKLEKEGIKLTHPKSKYKDLANKLYAAMEGIGTDENAVFQVFSNIGNDRDFIELSSAFGIRKDEDLTAWLASDLSSGKRAELNKYLRSRNIKYSV